MKCICSKFILNFTILFGGAIVIIGGVVANDALAESRIVSSETATAEIGKAAPAFTLKDTDGKSHNLSDFKGKIVVLEWFCPTCPYSGGRGSNSVHNNGSVKKLMKNMKDVDGEVVYLLIDSSTAKMRMSAEDLAKKDGELKKKIGIEAPILIDGDTSVAKAYGAKSTPHMFVIDGEGILRYHGAFSDRNDNKKNYVLDTVKSIKAGSDVEPTYVKQWGCGVRYQ
jgi:peroxiredoxin